MKIIKDINQLLKARGLPPIALRGKVKAMSHYTHYMAHDAEDNILRLWAISIGCYVMTRDILDYYSLCDSGVSASFALMRREKLCQNDYYWRSFSCVRDDNAVELIKELPLIEDIEEYFEAAAYVSGTKNTSVLVATGIRKNKQRITLIRLRRKAECTGLEDIDRPEESYVLL